MQTIQSVHEELGARSGEQAGDDPGQGQIGQIGQHGPGAHDGGGHQQLAQVVKQGGHGTAQPQVFPVENRAEQAHDKPGQQSAAHGIEQGHHLAGEHRPQKHPGQKDEQGVPRSQSEDGVHRDDVGPDPASPPGWAPARAAGPPP